MDAAAIHDPNIDYLYLNDMIGPEHPMYDEMKRRYANTPDGKRIEQFRKENDKYKDALQIATHGKLDNIIRAEGVNYTGDPTDRLGKIRSIRMYRSQVNDELVKGMTTEERKAYLEEADQKRKLAEKKAQERLLVDEGAKKRREAEKAAKRSAIDEFRYKRDMERRENQERNRQFLKDELARRSGKVNPVDARELAIKEREKKEKEIADAAEENDKAAKAEKAKDDKKTPPAGDDGSIKAPGAKEIADKKAGAIAERKDARIAELGAMKKPQLDALMDAGKLPIAIGMTNAAKAQAILDAEYPIK